MKTAELASTAVTAMHGHPFDSKHTFLVNHFTDVEKYMKMEEAYIEPQQEEYQPRVRIMWLCLHIYNELTVLITRA